MVFGLMLLTVTAICTQPANAADNGIYPPDSKPFGWSYGEWSAKWWQWVYSIPLETNPQLQGIVQPPAVPVTVTVDCSQGQAGPVWFLAATFGGWAVRECKDPIPADVPIFFPVNNTYFGVIGFDCIHDGSFPNGLYPFHPVNDCLDEFWRHPDKGIGPADQPKVHSWTDLVAYVTSIQDPPQQINTWVDGVPVPDLTAYRAKAPMFDVKTPAHNVLGYVWPGVPGQRGLGMFGTTVSDTYGPNGTDGYWLMLKPLTPGRHTIQFTAGDNPAWLNITYRFTVGNGK
jgi:hypothetical protein